MVFMEKVMSKNESEAIGISRLLKPENKANLLDLVHLAYFAENSARKSIGFRFTIDNSFNIEPQDFS